MLKTLGILFFIFSCTTHTTAKDIPIDMSSFSIEGKHSKFINYLGKPSLLLNNSEAKINNLLLTNGVIEYDVAFDKKRGFAGLVFRQLDKNNGEKFYIRPHQSGNPDANQYAPEYNGLSSWQLYHKGFAGKVNYKFNDWNHVKVVISGEKGEIYINDMTAPAFVIDQFLRPVKGGGVSFYSRMTDVYISNVQISNNEDQKLMSLMKPTTPERNNYITEWQISDSFDQKILKDKTEISPKETATLEWHQHTVDKYGIMNLAQVQGISKTANTVFAKFSINSTKSQTKALHFGYSDSVKVYVNNVLVYSGNNGFRSRDYRYLGTMGLFDTVYLALKEGKNEINFAVSESFGGWGVMAKLDDNQSLSF